MKSLKFTPEEAKEYAQDGAPVSSDSPKYPYGLCLHLNDDVLKKLGVTALPEVGKVLAISARAQVVSVGMNQQLDDGKEQRVELQITDMELTAANEGPTAASVLYGPSSAQ